MHAGTVTPEAVLLELPTAGVATRAFARLVDLAVQLVAASVLGTVLGFALPAGVSPVLMALVLMVAVLLVLPIAMEVASNGRSVGKAMFGLRAVGVDGSPVTTRQSMVRGVVGLVDFYLSLGFLATVTAMFSTTSQRSGDMAAGTVVIRSRTDPAAAVPIAFHLLSATSTTCRPSTSVRSTKRTSRWSVRSFSASTSCRATPDGRSRSGWPRGYGSGSPTRRPR